jgi:DNA-binding SARP family transcriptional activator
VETLFFKVLGPFEVVSGDGRVRILNTPKICQVLALLAVRSNTIVSADSIIEELWGDAPPRSALTTLQTYIYHSRKLFAAMGMANEGRGLLVTRAPGYMLEVTPEQVDAGKFEQLLKDGRAELADNRPENAVRLLRGAIDLWRGSALANISAGSILTGYIAHIEECRIQALELMIEAEKQLGRHRELIPELRALVNAYPLNEWFHGQLIMALSHAGRRAEALKEYQHLRGILKEELGLDPAPELQRIHHEVLNSASTRHSLTSGHTSGRVVRRPVHPGVR